MERTGKKKEEGLGEGYQYFFLYFPLLAMIFAVTMFLSYQALWTPGLKSKMTLGFYVQNVKIFPPPILSLAERLPFPMVT